jgi:hypothetical protein
MSFRASSFRLQVRFKDDRSLFPFALAPPFFPAPASAKYIRKNTYIHIHRVPHNYQHKELISAIQTAQVFVKNPCSTSTLSPVGPTHRP